MHVWTKNSNEKNMDSNSASVGSLVFQNTLILPKICGFFIRINIMSDDTHICLLKVTFAVVAQLNINESS